MKKYYIEIELDSFETVVSAKNEAEARKKALEQLKKKDTTKMIGKDYPGKRRKIWVNLFLKTES